MKQATFGLVGFVAAITCVTAMALAAATYLSDLPFTVSGLKGVANQGYFDGIRVDGHNTVRTMAGTFPTDTWDGPMKVAGTVYTKGLTFHMVHDETMKATWALGGRYSKLTGTVALDDYQGVPGAYPHVTVNFIGDGKSLATTEFTSVYGKPNPTPSFDVSLAGVKSLAIAVTITDAQSTNLDILNPQLQLASPSP
jgi:hypothetical protein